MEVSISSGDSYACPNLLSVMKISNIFKKAATANVDVSDYVNSASSVVNKYMSEGQDYLKSAITEGGSSTKIKLDLHLKAPMIIVPIDFHENRPYLVINLGEIVCNTFHDTQNDLIYENYAIILDKLESYIVWDHPNYKLINKAQKDHILQRVKISTTFSKASEIDFFKPAYKIKVEVDSFNISMNENKIKHLIKLQSHLQIESDEDLSMSQICMATFEEQIPFDQIPERKPMLDNLESIGKVVLVTVSATVHSTSFSLTEGNNDILKVSVTDMGFNFENDSQKNISVSIFLRTLWIEDLRTDTEFRNIISNPYLDPNNPHKFEEYQLRLWVKINPTQKIKDIALVINDIRIVVSKEFLTALMLYYFNHLSDLKGAEVEPRAKPSSYYMMFTSFDRYSVSMKAIEIWLPSGRTEKKASNVAHLSLGLTAVYSTSSDSRYDYASDDTFVSRIFNRCEEEAYVTLFQFTVFIMHSKNNEFNTAEHFKNIVAQVNQGSAKNKNIISPCRLSLQYGYNKSDKNLQKKREGKEEYASFTEILIRIESICMLIGFKDIDFFKELGKYWSVMPEMKQKGKSHPKNTRNSNIPKETLKELHEKKKEAEERRKKVVKKEEIDLITLILEGDAVQLTIVDDTSKVLVSLMHLQYSNLSVFLTKEVDLKVRLDILMFIDYFNREMGAWEPMIEDWKVTCKYNQQNFHQNIVLKSSKTLNFNFTYHLVQVLALITKKINESSEKWEQLNFYDSSSAEHGNIEYEIKNKLGIPIKAWIKMAIPTEKWLIDSSHTFPQNLIDKLHSQSNKKSKTTSTMNTVQPLTKLEFSLQKDELNTKEIIIEEVSYSVLNVMSDIGQFSISIEVSIEGGKRIITFDSAIFVSNNSDREITFEKNNETFEILPNHFKALPLNWTIDLDSVRINGHYPSNVNEKPIITVNSIFMVEDHTRLVLDHEEYVLDKKTVLKVLEINPRLFLKNMLPSTLEIFDSSNQKIKSIEPGDEVSCNIDSAENYYFRLIDKTTEKVCETHLTNFFRKKKPFKCMIKDYENSSIMIASEEKNFENYKHLKNYSKNKNLKEIASNVIKIYSEYIIVNKTQFELSLSGLVIPCNEPRYLSTKKSSHRLKMTSINTKESDKFSIDTIGVSGVVKLTQIDDFTPKHYLFGLVISQAAYPLSNSKVVTFTPRYMIWNYLDIPLNIRQYNPEGVACVHRLGTRDSGNYSMQFHFDNHEKSHAIVASHATEASETNEEAWSAPFDIENIEDLQIKFFSKYIEPKKGEKRNVFLIGWYQPRKNRQIRYSRVFIYSHDKATIHVAFLEPKDPDFLIINNTSEELLVRQKGSKGQFIPIPRESRIYWVWENNIPKTKEVEVMQGKKKKSFSIEKVDEKAKKKFINNRVMVKVEGVTRHLIIGFKEEEKPQEEKKIEVPIENEMSMTLKKKLSKGLDRSSTINSAGAKKETSNLGGTRLLEMIKSESLLEVTLKLKGIGVSIIDEDSKELFYITLKGIMIKHSSYQNRSGMNLKSHNEDIITLEHFQFDYMGDNEELFPILIYPQKHEKDEKEEKLESLQEKTEMINNPLMQTQKIDDNEAGPDDTDYYFFALVIERESSAKVKKEGSVLASMDKFNRFGIQLQEMQIKINEENIQTLMKVKNFFNAFSENTGIDPKYYLAPLDSSLPVLPFDPASFQRKAYFKEVTIYAMKMAVTFKQAQTESQDNEKDSLLMVKLIKKLGGAFINISESPFSFTEVHISDAFQTIDSFTWILIKKYVTQGIGQFYKLFGSIDIIGNPLGLIDKIGEGVIEFISAPARGLVQGPKSFAKGLEKGVKKLVSGVVGGGFRSMSKITGSLYNVLKTATGDEIVNQEIISTENIAKNMAIGLKDGLFDVAVGISGVFVKPYKGAKAAGAKGFFKGFYLGAFGLVTFPIGIVLKFSTVITNTIASTSYLITDGKIKKYGKIRFPRQFGAKRILEPYNKEISEAQALLQTIEKFKKHNTERIVYYSSIAIEKKENLFKENKNIILVLTQNFFLCFIDGELFVNVKRDSIQVMELHLYKDIYFLGIATKNKNFSIPSTQFYKLVMIYNTILSQGKDIPAKDGFKFEVPNFMDKGFLMEIKAIKSKK